MRNRELGMRRFESVGGNLSGDLRGVEGRRASSSSELEEDEDGDGAPWRSRKAASSSSESESPPRMASSMGGAVGSVPGKWDGIARPEERKNRIGEAKASNALEGLENSFSFNR